MRRAACSLLHAHATCGARSAPASVLPQHGWHRQLSLLSRLKGAVGARRWLPVSCSNNTLNTPEASQLTRTLSSFPHPGLPPKTDSPPPADGAAPTPPPSISDEALSELSSLTLDSYADQLKRARQMAGLASMLPKGMLGAAGAATDASVSATLKKQEDVIRCAASLQPVSRSAADSRLRAGP